MKRAIECIVLISVPFIGGCLGTPASPARMNQMTAVAPASRSVAVPLRENINVKSVTGGKKTNPILTHSNIGNDEFRGALEGSLKSAGLLARSIDEGKFVLSAQIIQVEHPLFGFVCTVTTHILYIMTDLESGKEVFHNTISAKYTATFSDAFEGAIRLQLANEGAARENIARLIEALMQLNISQGDVTLSH